MAGHSKWHNIRHRKGQQDAVRSKLFAKLSREIFVAAREGGEDPDTNPRLKLAIHKAKAANMPNENIDRALKKAAGKLEGENYEEITYEGYGPAGVAVMVDVLTDNRNRAAAEIRHTFSKHGGNLGEAGSVSWMFSRKGLLIVERASVELDEDTLMLLALEAGAEDFVPSADSFEIITSVEEFEKVKETMEAQGLTFSTAEITQIPKNTVAVEGEEAVQTMRLMEALEDNDDVQNVYANYDIDEAQMESL